MVAVNRKSLQWAAFVLACLLPTLEVRAAVTASVDRADVELNESFKLELTSDANIELQPDVSVLEQDFYIGQGSQLSNTTIANGQIRRSKTWTYVLMPKRAGKIVIPAISIGDENSNSLTVSVSEASYAPPGEAEVFVTTEVDYDETYVQAQVLLTVKIYRSVATRQPALRDPTVSGAEVLLESVGDDRSYEAVIDGTAYGVVERVIAIYPQESGEIQLSPARFEARVLRNGRITGRKVFQSEPIAITVRPAPPPPVDFPDAAWLPARDLELVEDWSRDSTDVATGEPLTRHITVSALGQLETQIPAMEPLITAGVNIYPDKPELTRRIEPGGIRGVRKDQYALIGVKTGPVVLPALELPWWNVEVGEWQIARLPQRAINFVGSGEPPMTGPLAGNAAITERVGQPGAASPDNSFWRRSSELLAAAWLLTLIGWWWSSRPRREPREPLPLPLHKQQARILRTARKAATGGDAALVRKALIEWGRLQWPDDAPRSIGVLAKRVSPPLAEELNALSKLSYGPISGDWDGAALATSLRSFSIKTVEDGPPDDLLPPLIPAS